MEAAARGHQLLCSLASDLDFRFAGLSILLTAPDSHLLGKRIENKNQQNHLKQHSEPGRLFQFFLASYEARSCPRCVSWQDSWNTQVFGILWVCAHLSLPTHVSIPETYNLRGKKKKTKQLHDTSKLAEITARHCSLSTKSERWPEQTGNQGSTGRALGG